MENRSLCIGFLVDALMSNPAVVRAPLDILAHKTKEINEVHYGPCVHKKMIEEILIEMLQAFHQSQHFPLLSYQATDYPFYDVSDSAAPIVDKLASVSSINLPRLAKVFGKVRHDFSVSNAC
ncbi:unnamed protein product [Schistosoma mattheei]|uniref:Uncharacterized protein n=1 Tax=Schistosoma mattheei TaxID=31246 RepID=A0A183PUY5_9TREM|nr:unnamed protein product [Schistosoma mattheei]